MQLRWNAPPRWTQQHLIGGAAAGTAGGAAYAIAMAADLRLFRYRADDYLLLGGAFGFRPAGAALAGRGIHIVNSALLGVVFERIAYRQLPFPAPVNGIVFASVENAVLYPVLIGERFHPLIKSGDLPSYLHPVPFAQSVVRHVAYGAVCGWAVDRLLKRSGIRA